MKNKAMHQRGTMVVGTDGFVRFLGQIADITTDRWGTRYQVAIDDRFEEVSNIGPPERKGIGWKIATKEEIEFHRKHGTEV